MAKPAPYPKTDAPEQEAVTTFNSLIDAQYVKTDIRTRDKVPNVDGTVELVDANRGPIGKFDIQIRKIPDGSTKCTCSEKLLGYSQVSSQPVVLVGVDTLHKKAYWKQIFPVMPEYKEGQKSFTISFDTVTDSVGPQTPYLRLWRDLVSDYNQRIAQFPVLQKEVGNKITLSSIPNKDKIYFQKFVDTINILFDQDFISVKNLLLPDVWKLGVGLYPVNQNSVTYQVYKILYGEPFPLICSLEGNPFDLEKSGSLTFSSCFLRREHLGDPEYAGRNFVLDYVKRIIKKRNFVVHGKLFSTEVLFAFLDQYSQSIGLKSDQDGYSVPDIDYGLKIYLPNLCDRIGIALKPLPHREHVVMDFDMVSEMIRQGTVPAQIKEDQVNFPFIMYSLLTPLKPVFESVRFLIANGITQVERPFLKPIRQLGPGTRWIWSGYTEDSERGNILKTLNSSVTEYSAFVSGNRLKFLNSPYLNPSTAVVYVYEPSKRSGGSDPGSWPTLNEYFIENPVGQLPKLSVAIGYGTSPKIESERPPIITIDGRKYSFSNHSSLSAGFLFQRTPIKNLIYRFLSEDLQRHYEIGHIA